MPTEERYWPWLWSSLLMGWIVLVLVLLFDAWTMPTVDLSVLYPATTNAPQSVEKKKKHDADHVLKYDVDHVLEKGH